ncbi:MAG: T9SS type A sorting domain-containing protein [Candidatus Cloacimonetes bacterium]|nr:T9SS type A sorting domain-containing protein [Candidatus Cloacimonadota bacterium]
MKMRFLFIFLSLIITSAVLSAAVIQTEFTFEEPTIKKIDNYDRITIDGLSYNHEPGHPEIPILPVQIIIPAGEEAVSVEVSYKNAEIVTGSFNVYPRQKPYPISYEGEVSFEEPANEVYSKNEFYPTELVSEVTTQYLRGHSIALLNLFPIQYNAVTKELLYHSSITISIETQQTAQATSSFQKFYRDDSSTKNRVKQLVCNPEEVSNYPVSNRNREITYDYIIITSSTYESNFSDFVEFKIGQGYNVFLKTTNEIYTEYTGADNSEKVRNFIIDAYETMGAEYILLGGDTAIVPYRGFWVNSYGTEDYNIPSDLYFSGLDRIGTGTGPDWNVDGDNKWGEHVEADYYSEVYLGRISAGNSAEFAAAINKQMMYQDNPVIADLEKSLMVGEELNNSPQTNGGVYKNEIVTGGYFNGYSTAGLPANFTNDTLYDMNGYWNTSQLFTKMNSGINLLNHLGHSGVQYNMKLYNSNVTNTNITANGTNHNYFIIYSQGCLPAAFEQDCIAEKFTTIENGCAVFVGNSRYGWYVPGGTNSSSQLMDREFFDALFGENITQVGPMNADSKEDNAAQCSNDNIRWVYYELILFGDPSLDVWSAIPEDLTATFQASIPLGTTEIDFQTDAPYARFGLIQNGEMIGNGTAGANGNATIEFFEAVTLPETISVSIIAHNKNRFESELLVLSNEPFVIFESYSVNDILGNGNSLPDFDESITFDMSLQNVGTVTANGVTAVLSEEDDYINITSDSNTFGDMISQQIVTVSDAFALDIADDVPDQHNVIFTIVASGVGQDDWTSTFNMTINAPELFSNSFVVSDVSGNNNGVIDPEEDANIIITAENIGHADSPITFVQLTCDNSDITIENDLIDVGQIAAQNNANAVFEISADSAIPVGTSVTFQLSITSGSYNFSTSFSEFIGIIVEDFENGDFTAFPWEFSGNADWIITTDAYEGSYSAKSGSIGNNAQSNLVLELDVLSDGDISFYRTVSSELNYDYLRFYIDNTQMEQWSGNVSWGEETYPISAGTHTVEWRYVKDQGVIGGTDCAQVDFITFPELGIISLPIINVNPNIVNIELGIDEISEETVELTNIGGGILNYTITLTGSPDWLVIDPANGSLTSGEMDEIALNFDTEGLVVGQYTSSMLIEDGFGEQTTVPVTLNVTNTGLNDNLPMVTELIGNYPNPFNPSTNIKFSLKTDSKVSLMIYNIRGQKVRTLVNDNLQAGHHSVVWDGRDDSGKSVSSGVYFNGFDSNDGNSGRYTSIKKIILLK